MSKPRLYLFVGYPGAGKTSVAKIIHEATGATHLWADFERHVMFEQPTHSHKESEDLYKHLNHLTDELLAQGKSVIFDTNFNYFKDRERLRSIAAKNGADTVLIWVTTPVELAKQRATLESDNKETRMWGNMPAEDFERMRNNLQPPSPEEHAVQIDGTRLDAEQVKKQLGLQSA